MRVVLSGASGLIGGMLRPFLIEHGHDVHVLVRRDPRPDAQEVFWDPGAGKIDAQALEGAEAVIHLSGQNVAVRWTSQRKQELIDSRVQSTRLLSETLARLSSRPKVLIAASAIGFYGERGDEIVTEDSPAGAGFFPDLCQAWEAASHPARDAGIRVVNFRIGVVLSAKGGALGKMLTPFRLGLGGRIGSGRQYLSWIASDDLLAAMYLCLTDDRFTGPVNAVGPAPATQKEFARTLARVLRRPAIFPLPAFMVRLLFGEMGRTLLLGSTRILPARLAEHNFRFKHTILEDALRFELQVTK